MTSSQAATERRPSIEFIGIIAALMALNALAIDILLPALDVIATDLKVANANDQQLAIIIYTVTFGATQILFGPLTDRFGRRAPLMASLIVYTITGFAAAFAPSFAALLFFRFAQAVASAAMRVVAMSVIRDNFGGRRMASVLSMALTVFTIVPVIAPIAGQAIQIFGGWHAIFVFVGLAGLAVSVWTWYRLSESLPPENRRPLSLITILDAFRIVATTRVTLMYALATAFIVAGLHAILASSQQIFVITYNVGEAFPYYFALLAVTMGVSTMTNAAIVGRLGMRRLSHGATIAYTVLSLVWFVLSVTGNLSLPLLLFFMCATMFFFGWVMANMTALAMEPVAAIAGTASSVVGFVQNTGGALLGGYIGYLYNGTTVPLTAGFFVCGLMTVILALIAERGRLFGVGT